MIRKVVTLLALLAILSMTLLACGGTPEPEVVETPVVEPEVEVEPTAVEEVPVETEVRETGPDSELDLILVQHALCAWDSFWCTVEAGIAQAAKDMNVNVTVLGPDEFDLEKTAQLIDQAVAAQPDGIALTVTDAD
ncbi:MAG: substrate-binding domain-containing protein, partial [Anaerolineae bacterium]|nr:substrate-binding domain-containing protein [Anaerolineae bacterium]